MERIEFDVQGSEERPYKVLFVKSDVKLSAYCTCKAGQVKQLCKHRLNIVYGESAHIVSGNEAEIKTVVQWVEDTGIADMLKALKNAELCLENAKREVARQKKSLALAMEG